MTSWTRRAYRCRHGLSRGQHLGRHQTTGQCRDDRGVGGYGEEGKLPGLGLNGRGDRKKG